MYQPPGRRGQFGTRHDNPRKVAVMYVHARRRQSARGHSREPGHQARASDFDHVGLFLPQDATTRPHGEHEAVGRLPRHARPAQLVAADARRIHHAIFGARDQQDLPESRTRREVSALFDEVRANAAARRTVELGHIRHRQRSGRARTTRFGHGTAASVPRTRGLGDRC